MTDTAENLDSGTSADDTLEEGVGTEDEKNLNQDQNNDLDKTEEDDTDNEISLLDMSDDDFAKALMDDFVAEPNADDKIKSDQENVDEEDSEKKIEETSNDEEIDKSESEDSDENEKDSDTSEEKKDLVDTSTDNSTTTDADKISDDDKKESDSEKEKTTEETDLSADEKIDKIFSPFRANGKDMSVKSVDDVRQLMQMGANYNKKMAALKPNLRLMKMLQNNDLLDESRLSFLIDLDKKNPDAIKKLIKDANIDIDDLDNNAEINYKPNTYTVNDQEIELDETLNDIRDTESFTTTLDIIGNKWDDASRAAILENPAAIRVLNDHISSGIYDKITAAVETERMFNRIPLSMSDLEAYKRVGDLINSKGGFTDNQTQSTSEVAKTVVKKVSKKPVDAKISERKKAAASTRSSPKSKSKENFNPLSMPDEEFEKVGIDRFM
jgi:hypothetical protein